MNVRFLIVPVALAISTVFVGAAATPALAAPATSCDTTPAQIRSAAANATPDQQRKVYSLVATGEKLCAENERFEAGKKFTAAAKVLGTDVAALTAPTAQ